MLLIWFGRWKLRRGLNGHLQGTGRYGDLECEAVNCWMRIWGRPARYRVMIDSSDDPRFSYKEDPVWLYKLACSRHLGLAVVEAHKTGLGYPHAEAVRDR